MEIKREQLVEALAIVKPGLASKEFIEQSTFFAFVDGQVITYNDEICIVHPVDIDIEGAVKADHLYQILSKFKEDVITIEITDSEIQIKCGKAKASLTLQEEIKLPVNEVLQKTSKWKKLPSDFIDGLSVVSPCCSTDMSRAILTCIYASESTLVGSDSYCICKFELESELPIASFLLPANLVQNVIRLNPTQIATGDGWVHFKNENNTLLSCRIFDDKYPDLGSHFSMEGAVDITFPKSTSDVIDRAQVFAKRDRAADELISVVLENKKMTLKGSCDTGRYEESLNTKYSGEKLEFSITPYLLKNILTKTNSCEVDESKILFVGENWEYVAMLRDK